jgi:hypothetical protein
MAYDQATQGRRNHNLSFWHTLGQLPAETFGQIGMLENQGALKIFTGMQAASEAKVTLQIGARLTKCL